MKKKPVTRRPTQATFEAAARKLEARKRESEAMREEMRAKVRARTETKKP